MRKLTFTTCGPLPVDVCPTGVSLELHGVDMDGEPTSEAHACIGGHARGEDHRLLGGYSWPAHPSEREPLPLVTFSVATMTREEVGLPPLGPTIRSGE